MTPSALPDREQCNEQQKEASEEIEKTEVIEGQQDEEEYADQPKGQPHHLWELHKENIQPLSQGRKIDTLIQALPLIDDDKIRKELFDQRKEQFDKDLEDCCDDENKKLDHWHEYIDWLEQNVPNGGKANGVTNAIEMCIELYYDKNDFKQDKRLFNIFMKFKRFCDEPTEIFSFMYANSICTLLACFYLNWSWQYEINKNMKRAEDLLKLGIKNLASPRDVLVEAQSQLKCRIDRMIRAGELDDCLDFGAPQAGLLGAQESRDQLARAGIRAALQTLKFKVNKKGLGRSTVPVKRIGTAVDQLNVGGLKSQTKLVNGVHVPKKPAGSGTSSGASGSGSSRTTRPNVPVQVFADELNNTEIDSEKIPTSQRIATIGRSGAENLAPKVGALTKRKV